MAASVLGSSESFLERSSSFSQVQMSHSLDTKVGHLFGAQAFTSTTASSSALISTNNNGSSSSTNSANSLASMSIHDSENAITLVSTTSLCQQVKPELEAIQVTSLNSSLNLSQPTSGAEVSIFDENSSSSNSTTSSKSRKRKSEKEILQRDMVAFGVPIKEEEPSTPVGTESKDGSKSQSPAFRLRPRRNLGCSFGSPSPFIMSPVKKMSKKSHFNSSTNSSTPSLSPTSSFLTSALKCSLNTAVNSAVESSKNLQAFLNGDDDMCEVESLPETLKLSVPMVRSFDKSIVRDLDVSVFAELISPLELKSGQVYDNNYVTLKVVESKPIRVVDVVVEEKEFKAIPVIELKAVDLSERFDVKHSKGVFDNPDIKQASRTSLSILLYGTYALRSAELVKSDDILGIVKFRTVSNNASDSSPTVNASIHNLRKRNSKGEEENSFSYPYSIIVDSLVDLQAISSASSPVKQEVKVEQIDDQATLVADKKDYELVRGVRSAVEKAPRLDELGEDKWAPFVSFCHNWRAPGDPKELNKSLYIFQPCVPKFESASSTVKM